MQDAYASESNAVGNWTLIGYKMDSNLNFEYTGYTTGNTTAINSSLELIGWQAQNLVAMNDCGANKGCTWKLTMTEDNGGNGVQYTPAISSDAQALTPSFGKLGNANLQVLTQQ